MTKAAPYHRPPRPPPAKIRTTDQGAWGALQRDSTVQIQARYGRLRTSADPSSTKRPHDRPTLRPLVPNFYKPRQALQGSSSPGPLPLANDGIGSSNQQPGKHSQNKQPITPWEVLEKYQRDDGKGATSLGDGSGHSK
ncbi:hypothetical protein G7046_g7524 [Stylonectria norvegica]|nr:hypothetical protein G7046_g7524 [Stylonectria norvegica]